MQNNLKSEITSSLQVVSGDEGQGSVIGGQANRQIHQIHTWDELPLCFGVETLAFIMGCSIGKARDICKNGGLCCYKEGKRYGVFKQDLLDWLDQRRKNLKRAKIA